ncbi:hypothetical protein EON73_04205 [bacterium]|nr:MAG: hypothetical protein EON73_04205 [bacterium]
MVILDDYLSQIDNFILTSIEKFTSENKPPSSIGIYCCPWAGWLTTNFNTSKTLEETENNCPDFEFVEFDFLELGKWQEEYEKDLPTFKISETVTNHNHNLGDEKLNELVFKFLETIATKIKLKFQQEILLQMLDSNCIKVL